MERICAACTVPFLHTTEDRRMLEKLAPRIGDTIETLPAPTFCPECRRIRRLTYRNERSLYFRTCDLTGKRILSTYSPDAIGTRPRSPVYELSAWISDGWSARDYGRIFDFNRPFFEQFFELHDRVPLPALDQKTDNENCDYTNLITGCRNCYFIFAATSVENSMYSTYVQRSREIVDSFFVFDSELCYECIDCFNCYDLRHSTYCTGCSESASLYDCKSCKQCIACVGLVNAEHAILNRPASPEEVQALRQELRDNPDAEARLVRQVEQLRMTIPHTAFSGISAENVSGNHISYSRNVHESYDCTYLEDSRNCVWMHKSKDCADCYGWGNGGELGYESHLIGNIFHSVIFSECCWGSVSNLAYCRYCWNRSKNLFGCVGLNGAEHCILNTAYTAHEYETLARRIVSHMRETGEWGEFFPSRFSPYAYNETVAQEYYPLTQANAEQRGFRWREKAEEKTDAQALCCEHCARPYRVLKQELAFYHKLGLPVPKRCFNCRYARRRDARPPRRLLSRVCRSCSTTVQTVFPEAAAPVLYCKDCYVRERFE